MKALGKTALALGLVWALEARARAHCEIPCGIYDDALRVRLIQEDLATIEKAMEQIAALSKAPDRNANQLARWIRTKEEQAGKIQHVVSQYFLTQRIKPAAPEGKVKYAKYPTELTLLHRMLIEAMKTKQTLDVQHVERLRSLLQEFGESYFGPAKEKPHGDAGHPH